MTKDRIWTWDERKIIPVWLATLTVCFLLGRCTAPLPNGKSAADIAYDNKVFAETRLARVCKNGMSVYRADGGYYIKNSDFSRVFLLDGVTPDQFCEKKE